VWPPQAADWPKRQKRGWPDSATIDRVVGKGCDLVGVAHRQCRKDEWMGKHQWRLSFSRAEVVLLNSWIPEQQIIYHMLRVFVKTVRLAGSTVNGEETLSNYHIKTLMLWACELKPQHWWNDGSTLIRKCLHLLRFLEEWLTEMRGQHYFINSIHFRDYFDKFYTDTVSATVRSLTEDSLAEWFVDNYIRKCARLCPDSMSNLCSDLVTSEISCDILSVIMQYRDLVCDKTYVSYLISFFALYFGSMKNCFKTLPSNCPSVVYDLIISPALLSLQQLDEHALRAFCHTVMVSEYLPIIRHDFMKRVICDIGSSADERYKLQYVCLESSGSHNVSHFQKAVILMELVAKKHRSTRRLLLIELSKIYLQEALECNNSECASVRCLVLCTCQFCITRQDARRRH